MHHHVHRPYSKVTLPYQRERLQQLQRIARAVLEFRDVRIESQALVCSDSTALH